MFQLSSLLCVAKVRLFAPVHASTCQEVQWLYMMIFGAGLVVGDEVNMNIKVEDGCAALLTSTSSTKVPRLKIILTAIVILSDE
jgi:urease accessory protein UreH